MHLGDHPDSSKEALREPIKSVFHLVHWSLGRCMKYISRPLPHPGLYDAARQGYPGWPLLQRFGAFDLFLPLLVSKRARTEGYIGHSLTSCCHKNGWGPNNLAGMPKAISLPFVSVLFAVQSIVNLLFFSSTYTRLEFRLYFNLAIITRQIQMNR
jgi:hypothetical protein